MGQFSITKLDQNNPAVKPKAEKKVNKIKSLGAEFINKLI